MNSSNTDDIFSTTSRKPKPVSVHTLSPRIRIVPVDELPLNPAVRNEIAENTTRLTTTLASSAEESNAVLYATIAVVAVISLLIVVCVVVWETYFRYSELHLFLWCVCVCTVRVRTALTRFILTMIMCAKPQYSKVNLLFYTIFNFGFFMCVSHHKNFTYPLFWGSSRVMKKLVTAYSLIVLVSFLLDFAMPRSVNLEDTERDPPTNEIAKRFCWVLFTNSFVGFLQMVKKIKQTLKPFQQPTQLTFTTQYNCDQSSVEWVYSFLSHRLIEVLTLKILLYCYELCLVYSFLSHRC